MKSWFNNTFPAAGRIASAELREQVARCWDEGIRRGGWEVSDLETIPFTLTITPCPVSLAAHTRNVTDCALAVGDLLNRAYRDRFRIDFDLLTAGSLLHDVGKLLEFTRQDGRYVVSASGRRLRHPISGCALAAEIGLPEPVLHIIAAHSWEGDRGPRTPEACIVHHCDFLNYEPLQDKSR